MTRAQLAQLYWRMERRRRRRERMAATLNWALLAVALMGFALATYFWFAWGERPSGTWR